ncbi:MAG: c-type cytochrome, partial [Acidobacteriota bacterium]|nr:c-type cytochrome [Acidobacteriota bacterium]
MSRNIVFFLLTLCTIAPAQKDWRTYGGNSASTRYSTLSGINRRNVAQLKAAWTYDTGDAFPGSEMQCQPIVINGVFYATTPKLRLIALDAATGKLRWQFDPNFAGRTIGKSRNRGIAYWESGAIPGEDRRIFVVSRSFLHAVDAATGKSIASFGNGGQVDLREELGRDARNMTISATSPGIVYKDLLILGSIVSETLPAAPGDIRAYDVHTGAIRWTFHTIPHPGEFGYETWPKEAWKYIGGANNWAGMSLDEKRGLVFVPTGSAAFDFYGSNRLGDNLFANTLLALDAATGKRVWHFQSVRHDLWDRDFPAPPTLVTVRHDGRTVDAVAQITKSGYVFLFERETGKPLFPIEYRKAAKSDVDGEAAAATQPFPLAPPPFARQAFTEDEVTQRTPAAHRAVLERLKQLRSDGQFVPPSLQGTVILPGFDGGGEWGGAAFDPQSGRLFVNANEMAWVMRLIERTKSTGPETGGSLYLEKCASCHRADRNGSPPEFPSLVGIGHKHAEAEIATIIRKGNGRMPGFGYLKREEINALVRFVAKSEDKEVDLGSNEKAKPDPNIEQKYRFEGYNKFLDS